MSIKTIHVTRGVLAAMSFWVAALVIAILIAVVTLHVLVDGGFSVSRLQP
jgi:hypothetical protein